MKIKKYIFPSLIICSVIALILRTFTKPTSAQPTSNREAYDEIDTYIKEQMHHLFIGSLTKSITALAVNCTVTVMVSPARTFAGHARSNFACPAAFGEVGQRCDSQGLTCVRGKTIASARGREK